MAGEPGAPGLSISTRYAAGFDGAVYSRTGSALDATACSFRQQPDGRTIGTIALDAQHHRTVE